MASTIKCPKCETTIDIDKALYEKLLKEEKDKLYIEAKKKVELEQNESISKLKEELLEKSNQVKELNLKTLEIEKIKREKDELESKIKAEAEVKLNEKLKEEREKLDKVLNEVKEKEIKIEQEKKEYENNIQKELEDKLKKEKDKLYIEAKKKVELEQNESISKLKEELLEKSNQVKELNLKTLEIEKIKREKDELESKIKAEAEVKLNEKLKEEREKLQKNSEALHEMKLKEKEEQLEGLKKQLQDAQRKIEQGSVQLQGEVQELAIEEWLKSNFPLDTVEEIRKGVRGGDCILIIHTREMPNCGRIYFESKRTKDFQKSWIEKFKDDMREKGIEIGVLVTDVYPRGIERATLIEGVWICNLEEFKALSTVLRDAIIKISQIKRQQENRHDKISLMYEYLMGEEFKMQIEAIVEAFTNMQRDLESEQKSIQTIWKKREKQIQKVLTSTTQMYGSIQGIGGISNIKSLSFEEE